MTKVPISYLIHHLRKDAILRNYCTAKELRSLEKIFRRNHPPRMIASVKEIDANINECIMFFFNRNMQRRLPLEDFIRNQLREKIRSLLKKYTTKKKIKN